MMILLNLSLSVTPLCTYESKRQLVVIIIISQVLKKVFELKVLLILESNFMLLILLFCRKT